MIDEKDIERLKEIFITKNECNHSMDAIEQKINADNIRLAVIESQLKIITGLLMAVGTGVISMMIKMFFFGAD